MKSLETWIKSAEQSIVNGHGQQVKTQLRKLQHKGVPETNLIQVARLAIRVNMFHFAATILAKRLHVDWRKSDPEILAIYARSIAGLGNYSLAREIFEELSPKFQYESAIYYSDCLFREWNYKKGLQVLSMIDNKSMSDYQRLIYNVNLSASLIHTEDFQRAQNLLKDTLLNCKNQSYNLLKGNCLELLGQIQFFKGSTKEAIKFFKESEKILRLSKNQSWLYSLKWLVLGNIKLEGLNRKNIKELKALQLRAREHKHWETLRDIDLQLSIITENEDIFSHCYFGSPHEAFRKHMMKKSKNNICLNSTVNISKSNFKRTISYNSTTGHFSNGDKTFNFTQHRTLINSLIKDLYRPRSVFELFRDVYNEPYFNKISSPAKIYKKTQSLRSSINNLPAKIEISSSKKFGYRLRCEHNFYVTYSLLSEDIHYSNHTELLGLKEILDQSEFTTKQVVRLSKKPQRSVNRWLSEAVSDGLLIRLGSGKNTSYRFKKSG